MKKRIVTAMVVLIFLGSICVGTFNHPPNYVYAENEENLRVLIPYEEELESLNKEWGTNYKLQLEDGNTEQEMIEYFTSMSMEEFREYIKEVHELDMESLKKEQTNKNIRIEKNTLP